jgi:hypothetical protein
LLLNPDEVAFGEHLRVENDGEIVGLTIGGRDIINILGLDSLLPTNTRKQKLGILKLYKRYPTNPEVIDLYLDAFGFPDDLPDLATHTRSRNTMPKSVSLSYYHQRKTGVLPQTFNDGI